MASRAQDVTGVCPRADFATMLGTPIFVLGAGRRATWSRHFGERRREKLAKAWGARAIALLPPSLVAASLAFKFLAAVHPVFHAASLRRCAGELNPAVGCQPGPRRPTLFVRCSSDDSRVQMRRGCFRYWAHAGTPRPSKEAGRRDGKGTRAIARARAPNCTSLSRPKRRRMAPGERL